MPDFVWDSTSKILEDMWGEILNRQVLMTSERSVSAFYVVRVEDRTRSLTKLFVDGHYIPAVPLVRVAYEDWISSATILAAAAVEDDSADDFLDDLAAEYVRLYRRFVALCGVRAARKQFPSHPEYAKRYLDDPSDPPHKPRDWRVKASSLGLETVHDVAYNYLSDLSHGSFHSYNECIGVDAGHFYQKEPTRDHEREEVLALWAYWFHLRTLTIAGSTWNRDYEHVSDEWLKELRDQGKHRSLATCVMRREKTTN